nr:hypothetical protein RWETBTHO_RWETBTHO_CDS_0006 [Microvirus sp.]
MTTKELEQRVSVSSIGSGTFRFSTTYYGKAISAISNDSIIYDIITFFDESRGLTYRQALQYVHEQVVKNYKKNKHGVCAS